MMFVHSSFKDAFLEKFVREVESLKLGMPWEKGVKLTPLPEDSRIEYLKEAIEDAQAHGAKVVNAHGGTHNANFFYPAVLWGVNDKARLWREEQFGPVVPMTSFDDISAPLDYVVDSDFGQQVSIFGHDQKRMAALMDTLVNQVCRVNINTQCQRGPDVLPFTGRKDSAEGTLSVSDALRVFSIRTLVAARDSAPNKELINGIVRGRKSKFLSTDFIL
jgi:glyceraldehyde-3-phosphate dehydrogenase (NADP+)